MPSWKLSVFQRFSNELAMFPRTIGEKIFRYRWTDFEKVKLKFTDGALRAIAQEALHRNTGARGLRSIMEEIMLDTMYELPSRSDVQECTVTEEAVTRRQQPALLYKQAS